MTIFDVMKADAGVERDEMLKRWAAAVWESWRPAHEWARALWGEFERSRK